MLQPLQPLHRERPIQLVAVLRDYIQQLWQEEIQPTAKRLVVG